MRRSGQTLALCALGLIGSLAGIQSSALAADSTEEKGAKIYCFMRSSGNDHSVSWNASYAVIKRQGNGMFKTSPEHASVMITEAVVNDPGNFPDCGQYLGDLFGGSNKSTSGSSLNTATNTGSLTNYDNQGDPYAY